MIALITPAHGPQSSLLRPGTAIEIRLSSGATRARRDGPGYQGFTVTYWPPATDNSVAVAYPEAFANHLWVWSPESR